MVEDEEDDEDDDDDEDDEELILLAATLPHCQHAVPQPSAGGFNRGFF